MYTQALVIYINVHIKGIEQTLLSYATCICQTKEKQECASVGTVRMFTEPSANDR